MLVGFPILIYSLNTIPFCKTIFPKSISCLSNVKNGNFISAEILHKIPGFSLKYKFAMALKASCGLSAIIFSSIESLQLGDMENEFLENSNIFSFFTDSSLQLIL